MIYQNIKLVIFDMDGLMFDTEKLGLSGWEYAFEKLGLNVPNALLKEKIGLNSKDSKQLMIKEIGDDFDYNKAKEIKRSYVLNYINKNGTPIKEGLLELLSFLDDYGIKKAVATSRSLKYTDIYISKSIIKSSFEVIITGDMVDKGKPNPDIFLKAANILGIEPKKTMVLEDSLNGIKAANQANMLPVLIPDLVLPDKEIKKLIFAQCTSLIEVIDLLKELK